MSTISEFVLRNPGLATEDIDWLHSLVTDWQLVADLAGADLVLWLPDCDGEFEAVAHKRPNSVATVFIKDQIGLKSVEPWQKIIAAAYSQRYDAKTPNSTWRLSDGEMTVQAVAVRRLINGQPGESIAVLTQHSLNETHRPDNAKTVMRECADLLLGMVSEGAFPNMDAPTGQRYAQPRVSDGLIRVGKNDEVTYASPNALSAYVRLGFEGDLESENLTKITLELLKNGEDTDDALPLITSATDSWRADIEANGATVLLRSVPLYQHGEWVGGIILCRDVTEYRKQEQKLMTKDATIREIHHRVKNNLQTVASLLRIQSRRTQSEEAQAALIKAMRRVESIALVHDTLSQGLDQRVDFDAVFERMMQVVTEIASPTEVKVYPMFTGSFGELSSETATPLALALTELVTNAVEHGLKGSAGEVWVRATRDSSGLTVVVSDNGEGLPEGKVGSGLGTQIIRTLVEGELSGSIDWHTLTGSGTEVTIEIPESAL